MGSEFVIMCWQKVMVIHDLHEVGCSPGAHFGTVCHRARASPVEASPAFHDRLKVNDIVQVTLDPGYLADHSLDLLIAEDGTDATAAGLLQPYLLSLRVIEAEVEHADQRMFSSRS